MDKVKFFVIGHVDSGKSTLIGQLLYKSGEIKKLDSTSKESTKYSDLLDVEQSERDRGITQFSSINTFTYNNIIFEVIDTPGHLLYIREVINSISQHRGLIGCLLLSAIVDEFDSMFNSGTTKEDCILMRCCGINHILICLNKIDKVKDENLESNINTIKEKFNSWVSKLGFKSITYCSISGYGNINLFERSNITNLSLIENLITINSNIKIPNKEKIFKNKNKCKLNFYTFDLERILIKGFKSIFHIIESSIPEIEGEIVFIKNKNTNKDINYINSNENVFMFVLLNDFVDLFEGQRLILREGNKTLGFGYVMFS